MSDSQFGFRPGRGIIDAICIIRQIIEKAREHQVPLPIHFIDFMAAFDTIWREALWKIMIQIGIPQKYVAIIKTYITIQGFFKTERDNMDFQNNRRGNCKKITPLVRSCSKKPIYD